METQWGGLKNPKVRDMVRNGLASPSSRAIQTEGGRIQRKYLCGFETLVYYFGEEWFDLKDDAYVAQQRGRDAKKRANNQPSRCSKCKREWATESTGGYFLDESFVRLPMLSQDCHECS